MMEGLVLKGNLRIVEETESRPRLYWFEDDEGFASEAFFMGDIKEKVKFVESLGLTVTNKEEYER